MNTRQRVFITLSVMAATVMQVLDISIVNVALPDMQGNLSATPDQISWVLTAYLVSSAIFMPLTGFLSDHFGRKNWLLISILGFTISSILCGGALSIPQIVIFRLLQGIFGASLVPLSQAIMLDIFPKSEHGKAMAIWGMGVMVGPILGPTLGGYLTELYSWRWTFYINVPIGLASMFIIFKTMPDYPKTPRSIHVISLLCLAIAIGSVQMILDRGNEVDWYNDNTIRFLTLSAIGGFLAYILLPRLNPTIKPIFSYELFENRNFLFASAMIVIMGFGLFGSMLIQTLMLQHLLYYPAYTAGLVMAPRGVASMCGMFLVSKFHHIIDARIFITTGLLLNIIGCSIGTHYNLNISPGWALYPGMIQGLGLGMVMIPLSTLALSTLKPNLTTEGAGLFSLMRTLGFSIGISIIVSIVTHKSQVGWNTLSGFITPYAQPLYTYLEPLNLTPMSPQAGPILANLIQRQSFMNACIDGFYVLTLSFVCMLPLVFLLVPPKKGEYTSPITE